MPRTRILNLPFPYQIRGIAPRKRKPEGFTVRGMTPVAVPELTAAEAPLAITLVYRSHYEALAPQDRERYYPRGPGRQEYRFHDGRLYVPVEDWHGGKVTVEEFARDVSRPSEDWGRYARLKGDDGGAPAWRGESYPELPGLERQGYGSQHPMHLSDVQEMVDACAREGRLRIQSDDRAACEAVAQEILGKGLVIVDGTVWTTRSAWEPHWVVAVSNGKVSLSSHLAGDSLAYVHGFRLDRRDEAVRFAKAVIARKAAAGEQWAFEEEGPDVEILLPEAVRRDHAVMVARQILGNMGANIVNREDHEPWGEAGSQAWDRLRQMRDDARGRDPSLREAAEVIGLAERLTAILDADGLEGNCARDFRRGTREALSRWAEHERGQRPDVAAVIEDLEGGDIAALAGLVP